MKLNDSPPEPTAAEDAALLFPDVDVTIRDPDSGASVTLTVREFRFMEGLRLTARVRPLIEAIGGATGEGGDVAVAAIADAITEHAVIWVDTIAQATGRDAEWIGRLAERDGQALSAAQWKANKDFFCRRIIEEMRRRREAGRSPSPTSSTPSSGPGTGADTATSPSG